MNQVTRINPRPTVFMNHKSLSFYKFGSAVIPVASFAIALSTAVPDASAQI